VGDVRSLGSFIPSAYQSEVIEAEIRPLLPPCCQRERISVRVPRESAPAPHPDNLQWHQDGGGAEGTTQHMVIWASELPTDILTSRGVYAVQPFEVIWFDNTRVLHRQPTGTDETSRWFVSIRCSGAMA
jgi:hypothetical protein